MKLLSFLKRRVKTLPLVGHPMIGKVIMYVQLDGCMSHIATIRQVGVVIDVKTHEELHGHRMIGGSSYQNYEYAICHNVVPELGADERDPETFRVPLFDNWFAPAPGTDVYVWRH